MEAPVKHRPALEDGGEAPSALFVPIVYVVAFITGAIVMSFEMLGSRYLGPFFGSGIFTWASLISTVLAALCVGYFLGGAIADRHPSVLVLAGIVAVGSVYLVVLPTFAQPVLQFFVASIDDIKLGSLLSALAIMFFPVALLGTYSPFAIRLLLPSRANSGTRLRHRLWRLHRRQHPRHAGDDVLSDPAHRLARDYLHIGDFRIGRQRAAACRQSRRRQNAARRACGFGCDEPTVDAGVTALGRGIV